MHYPDACEEIQKTLCKKLCMNFTKEIEKNLPNEINRNPEKYLIDSIDEIMKYDLDKLLNRYKKEDAFRNKRDYADNAIKRFLLVATNHERINKKSSSTILQIGKLLPKIKAYLLDQ
jgi:hypothetical protein